MTAGKMLHDFKLHSGAVTSIEFHPNEFLLASGSADRTVKFWDLETMQMIASTSIEASRVRAVCFGSDNVLFSGGQDSLRAYNNAIKKLEATEAERDAGLEAVAALEARLAQAAADLQAAQLPAPAHQRSLSTVEGAYVGARALDAPAPGAFAPLVALLALRARRRRDSI